MTVSFVGSASAEATSLALPAHQAGDLIVMLAGRVDSASAITIPSAWSHVIARGVASPAFFMSAAYLTAASGAVTSGTWTGAQMLLCVVVRDSANYLVAGVAAQTASLPSTLISYPALGAKGTYTGGGTMRADLSYVLGCGLFTSNTSDAEGAPSGMTSIVSRAGTAAIEMVIHRTDAAVSTFSGTFTASTAVGSGRLSIELLDTGISKSAGGGMIVHPGMSGGMRG